MLFAAFSSALAGLAGLVLTLGMGPARAAEPPVRTITWVNSDSSGVVVPGERASGNANANAGGMAARLITFMEQHWPQVKHELLLANARRSQQMIEAGEPVCRANWLRTPEREKIAYFTNMQLTPPLQLIVRRDTVAKLPRNAAGEVILPQLLADKRLQGALVDGRSYGATLDEVLAKRPANAAVTLYSPRDAGVRMLQMLALSRTDWAIDFDMALVMVGETPTPLVSVPIQGASELLMGGVACPRNAWGLAAIRGIDRALGTPAGAQMLRESLLFWLTPEARAHYGPRLDAFYRERAKPTRIEP